MLESPGIGVVDRLPEQSVLVGHNWRDHVHQLRQARHAHAIRTAYQGIQQPTHHQGVLEIVNLFEQVRRYLPLAIHSGSAARPVPHVPLVERQPQSLVGPHAAPDHIAHGHDLVDLAVHVEVHGQISGRVSFSFLGVAEIAMQ